MKGALSAPLPTVGLSGLNVDVRSPASPNEMLFTTITAIVPTVSYLRSCRISITNSTAYYIGLFCPGPLRAEDEGKTGRATDVRDF